MPPAPPVTRTFWPFSRGSIISALLECSSVGRTNAPRRGGARAGPKNGHRGKGDERGGPKAAEHAVVRTKILIRRNASPPGERLGHGNGQDQECMGRWYMDRPPGSGRNRFAE